MYNYNVNVYIEVETSWFFIANIYLKKERTEVFFFSFGKLWTHQEINFLKDLLWDLK